MDLTFICSLLSPVAALLASGPCNVSCSDNFQEGGQSTTSHVAGWVKINGCICSLYCMPHVSAGLDTDHCILLCRTL
ncbi:hypothetical protein COO60DRAFT_988289 [Scenedesmus sp. NREL 46B-D3]|nr:hypothetical protein COO60DRAFT_988289 [Scenedesmus sp. NREL 46B-D3]